MSDDLGRTTPHNLDAEKAILGSILLDNRVLGMLDGLLVPTDFYRTSHKRLFRIMRGMHERRIAIDPVTLEEELVARKALDEITMDEALKIRDGTPHATNSEWYARIVRECAIRRLLIGDAHRTTGYAYDRGLQLDHIIGDAEARLAIANAGVGSKPRGPDWMAEQAIEALMTPEQRAAAAKDIIPEHRVPTGLAAVDVNLPGEGLGGGWLFIVAALLKTGKSSLMATLAANMALAGDRPFVASLEPSPIETTDRIIGAATGLPVGMYRSGDRIASASHVDRITDVLKRMREQGGPLIDGPGRGGAMPATWEAVRTRIRQSVLNDGCRCALVDQLSHVQCPRPWGHSKKDRYEAAANAFKDLAGELDIPIVLLAQLRIPDRQDKHKPPSVTDTADCRTLAREADLLGLLWRTADHDTRGVCEFLGRGNRHGPEFDCELAFDKESGRFSGRLRGPRQAMLEDTVSDDDDRATERALRLGAPPATEDGIWNGPEPPGV